jgi:acetyltransferase-like isoleucine patch superfamily enzyme
MMIRGAQVATAVFPPRPSKWIRSGGGRLKKNIVRRSFNRIAHLLARFSPGATSFRPFLHKLRNVQIGRNVFIGEEVYIENEHPECVEIGDDAQIALRATIMAHFRGPGRVMIGKKVWIGPGCVIAGGSGRTLTIGEGSMVAALSVVVNDVPPYTFVGGAPAKPIARVTVPMTVDTTYEDWKKGLRPLDEEPTADKSSSGTS